MANEWAQVVREVASRMNAIAGATAAIAESNYNTSPIGPAVIDDASYHYSMLLDACANAEQMIAQAVATANNHPWRHVLNKGQLLGVSGAGLAHGALIYAKPDSPPGTRVQVTDCLGLGPVMSAASGGKILREAPIEDIQRRVDNPGTFFVKQVYFYRIQDDRIFHTCPLAFIDYYSYDKQTDTVAKYLANGSILFPHTAIPAYVAGALSMLLKEEEYAGQCQYYAAMFAGMLQQIVQGFTTVDPLGAPAPHKGTEST
jgi:hypothetical protein